MPSSPLTCVWVVGRVLPDVSPTEWELNGVYTSLEDALAACDLEGSVAAEFQLNFDYSGCDEFWTATPDRPTPHLTKRS